MLIFNTITEEHAQARAAAERQELDESLIPRIAECDREALAEVYHRTKSAVFGFALSILRNRQNAEDVLQDTYIKIWDNAAGYKPQGKPMAWILTIVRNLCLMRLRERRNRDVPIDEQLGNVASPATAEGSLDRIVLERALSGLSDEERQIVMLHSLSGLKHREIGDILQLPLSTVLSKYRRALAKLKSLLEEEN